MTCVASLTIAGVEHPCTISASAHENFASYHTHAPITSTTRGATWWEEVPPPEREWQPGDFVVDASKPCQVALRRGLDDPDAVKYPWLVNTGWHRDAELVRPLTWLVPKVTP